jgi:hypothetical protein
MYMISQNPTSVLASAIFMEGNDSTPSLHHPYSAYSEEIEKSGQDLIKAVREFISSLTSAVRNNQNQIPRDIATAPYHLFNTHTEAKKQSEFFMRKTSHYGYLLSLASKYISYQSHYDNAKFSDDYTTVHQLKSDIEYLEYLVQNDDIMINSDLLRRSFGFSGFKSVPDSLGENFTNRFYNVRFSLPNSLVFFFF